MRSPVVWQVVDHYLPRTETFIYTALNSLRRTQPVIISYGKVVNLDTFPIGVMPLHCLDDRLRKPRYLPVRAFSKLIRRDWTPKVRHKECVAIARKQAPKLIHAHFGSLGYHSLSLRDALNVPLITTFYGYDTNPTPNNTKWQSERRDLLLQGDHFLVEGPFMRETLTKLGCPPERIKIQRIGVDLEQLPPIKRKAPRLVPVILLAARFVEKKGLQYGLSALCSLHRAGYRFECRIIGNGPLETALREFVVQNKLTGMIRFLGGVRHSEYLEELSNADIFVQPSVIADNGDTEGGAPTTILEAQACGVPVISTTHADIPNIVVRDQSAILVSERNSEELAAAMARLLTRPQDWPGMGRVGRQFVEQYHSAAAVGSCLEDTYFSLTS
jgi:colanic acid/amylovoran biosynthesis glycosyltransferase